MIDITFDSFPVMINFILFAASAAVVWVAGTNLAVYADTIADRRHIGKNLMGLVFLAAATELPELVTTISAALDNNAELVLNNMFGGITMQTAILAVADVSIVRATLTFYPRKTTLAVEGTLLTFLLAFLLAIIALGDLPLIGHVGVGTLVLGVAYIGVIQFLRWHEADTGGWLPLDVPEEEAGVLATLKRVDLERVDINRLYGMTAVTVLAILLAGMALVKLAEVLAVQTGLGSSFIGVTVLAASTSLPELSTTLAAVRIGAYTMAISNIFGSNLIMLALLLPADIFFRPGRLLEHADLTAQFALLSGIMVTSIYVTGLLVRSRRKVLGMGIDSLIVAGLYLASLVVFYRLS